MLCYATRLQVYDYDFGPQRDDFLGDAAVDMRSLRSQSTGRFEVPLSIQGHVYLSVQWLAGQGA
jgi:Ca2+-dependent lipid-binding protein